ncbi:hypothetical protein SADUNF_Sadunf05G0084100 [Salix dunnii]|uniref:Uncharacterized protein n=1 Tax=Salix dunnii TaxID=1413687 RepID=A0A835K165_9ROSI|nr:hypothetical protein SADUNF_Sadunf05G0084100 [Salix dunnii]
MAVVSKIDHKSALDRLNGDPSLSVISSGLKTTNGVLEQEGDGAGIGMAFESKCKKTKRKRSYTCKWLETMKPPFLPPDISNRSFSSGGKAKNSLARVVISDTSLASTP